MTYRIALLAAITFGCTSLAAAETKNIDRTVQLSASGTVSMDVHNGEVVVRTWDRPEVEVHVRIESHGSSSVSNRRLSQSTVDIDGSPDHVSIRSRIEERDAWSLWTLLAGDWADTPVFHYTITAPKTARWQLHDHNANVEIRDVSAPLEISTHNGSVRVLNLGGPLELSMHNGYANVDFASFTKNSRITTHNGTVELAMPASSRFNLDARGHHIHVASDFQSNTGGPDLRLDAHNARFRLRSK